MHAALTREAVEVSWERLAGAIDRAGPERESLCLAKLAILLANGLGDRARAEALIATALEDLT